jgi:hypothetical protein
MQMRLTRQMQGLLAGAAMTAAALVAVTLATSARATQIEPYDRDRTPPPRLILPFKLQDDHPRSDDPYEQERRAHIEQERLLGPSPYEPMRDGGPPPWDNTRWGQTR